MPQPTMSDLHVDAILTNLSVKFALDNSMFVADKVFPVVRSQHRSDLFYTYPREYWLRSDAELRGPGAESAGSGYEISSDSFSINVIALHKDVDDMTRANADSQFSLDREAAEFVTQHLLQKKETDFFNAYFNTGVWGTDITPANKWSDYTNGDPIGDLRTGVITMAKQTGYKPNTLVLGPEVWNKLQDHPDFLERIKYTERAIMGTDLLASMLGLDRVMVPWAIKNTSPEGVTAAYDFHLGKNALLAYVAPSAGLNTVSAGYTFAWTGYLGAGANGMRMKRFRLERNASDRIEGEYAVEQKVVAPELGYYFNAAVA